MNNDGALDIVASATSSVCIKTGLTTVGVAPLLQFSLATQADALQAASRFDQKLTHLSNQRGTIGAFLSRSEVAVNMLQSSADNSAAAYSRIMDADIAEETAEMVRLQVLQQSAAAILAQANLQPSLVLKLLNVD